MVRPQWLYWAMVMFCSALMTAIAPSQTWGRVGLQQRGTEVQQLTAAVSDALFEAMTVRDEGDPQAALVLLNAIEPVTLYDTAYLHQTRGHTYLDLDDLSSALAAFEAATLSGGFDAEGVQQIEYLVLQLMIGEGDPVGIERALADARTPEPVESAFNTRLYAYAYWELDAHATALDYARKARALHGRPDTTLDRMIAYLETVVDDTED